MKPTAGIAVDAATHGNPGAVEWRGIDLATGKIVFQSKLYPLGTNNAGEFCAVVHALAYLKEKNLMLPVYTDSTTAQTWVRNRRANIKSVGMGDEMKEVVSRAEQWLSDNPIHNDVMGWMTYMWGDVPADYGRKG